MRLWWWVLFCCASACITVSSTYDIVYVGVDLRGLYNNMRGIIPTLLLNGNTVTVVGNDRLIGWVKEDFVEECWACDELLPRLHFESWGNHSLLLSSNNNISQADRASLSKGDMGPEMCEAVGRLIDNLELSTAPILLQLFHQVS